MSANVTYPTSFGLYSGALDEDSGRALLQNTAQVVMQANVPIESGLQNICGSRSDQSKQSIQVYCEGLLIHDVYSVRSQKR